MTTWPITLPQSPTVAGNSAAFGENRLQYKPDRGRAMMRARSSVRDDDVTFTFQMTRDQFAIFEAFYRTDLGDGVLPFDYLDPTLNATRTFQFKSPPQHSFIKPFYMQVTVQLLRFGV